MTALKDFARRAAYTLGLTPAWYALNARFRPGEASPSLDEDGVPIPPAALIRLVVGDVGWRAFLERGEKALRIFADAATRAGVDFAKAERVLDFGCGCGRLARHRPKLSSAVVYGFDYTARLAGWCASNLSGTFRTNRLHPPLDAPDGHFDVAYLLSVFTHLRPATQDEWLVELARVIRPGGVALITFHDEDHPNLAASGLTREALIAEGLLIHNDAAEGSNLIGTFQSRAYVASQFGAHFEVVEITPTPKTGLGQALAVLRRRG
ncbi:MAG: class I SAM-dependent methyltransferase [Parvularculaceae bacterium]